MSEIKKMLTELRTSDYYINLVNYYATTSFFNIICKERSETTHSNFIAWILGTEESHGLGEYPLRQLLLLLAMAKSDEQNAGAFLPQELEYAFLIGDYDIHEVRILREYPTGQIFSEKNKKKKGFIDILIEVELSIDGNRKKLPIIIENKVKSKENEYFFEGKKYYQTNLYYMWAESKFEGDEYYRPLYVFLTPDKTKAINENYIDITYQGIVDIVLQPCLKNKPSDDGKVFINNYLRCLSYSEISEEEEKKGYVMAFTYEEKELLKKFYETNKPLLVAVAQCLQEDDDLSEEDKAVLGNFTQIIVNRDYTKYNFNGQTKLTKGKLVLAIVKEYVKNNSSVTYEELKKEFPDEYQGSCGVVKKRDEIKDPGRYLPESIILSDGTEIFVGRGWGIGTIGKIIDKAKQLGYTIDQDL